MREIRKFASILGDWLNFKCNFYVWTQLSGVCKECYSITTSGELLKWNYHRKRTTLCLLFSFNLSINSPGNLCFSLFIQCKPQRCTIMTVVAFGDGDDDQWRLLNFASSSPHRRFLLPCSSEVGVSDDGLSSPTVRLTDWPTEWMNDNRHSVFSNGHQWQANSHLVTSSARRVRLFGSSSAAAASVVQEICILFIPCK